MCLAIPGRVVKWLERSLPFAQAEIEFEQTRRICHMACVPEAEIGDYVIVHAGIAIARVDANEGERILQELRALEEPRDPGSDFDEAS